MKVLTVPNTAEISTAPLLPFFLVNSRQSELQKVWFSLMWNLKTVC